MPKYYELNLYSEDKDLSSYDKIIVKKGLFYAKEICTDARIMICDNSKQGWFYDYYVLSSDFKPENIVRLETIREYINKFKNKLPIYSNQEDKQIKKLIKQYRRNKQNSNK